jgi:3-methyladenine DNA glycosylase AlkD
VPNAASTGSRSARSAAASGACCVLVQKDTDAALIERDIRAAGSPSRAASEQNYLKSSLEFSGTTVPAVRAIVTGWRRSQPDLTRERLTQLAAALWDGPIFECRLAAVILLTDRQRLLAAGDAALVEEFLRTADTWALVDGLAADVMGSLVERFPELLDILDGWVADDNFWIRRSAMLALLVPLRRGDVGNWERFAGYADAMLAEREFFIRKAIGWVLRETAKKHPDLVAHWVEPRVHRMSGVTIREAVRWLPGKQQAALLADYRQRSLARPERGVER